MKNKIGLFFLLFLTLLILGIVGVHAQKRFNINDKTKTAKTKSAIENVQMPSDFLKNVEEYREFYPNPQLKRGVAIQVGDEIEFEFSATDKFVGTVISINEYVKGITAITAKINGYDYAYGFMSISDKGCSISVKIPEAHGFFSSAEWNDKAYLLKFTSEYVNQQASFRCAACNTPNASNLPRIQSNNILQKNVQRDTTEYEVKVRPKTKSLTSYSFHDPNTEVTIRLMYVFTHTAVKRMEEIGRGRGKENDTSNSLQEFQLLLDNSKTGVKVELARIEEIEYDEEFIESFLWDAVFKTNPTMQVLNDLRDSEDIDVVVLVTKQDFWDSAGGVAYAPATREGDRNWCGFVSVGVNNTYGNYTAIHEFGHTFGCQHSLEQSCNPPPAHRLFKYGTAWKGITNNRYSITVMGYPAPACHNGNWHTHLPYFSSPDIIMDDGVAIGNHELANNRLVIRQMKFISATYGKGMVISQDDKNVQYGSSATMQPKINKHNFELRSGDKIVYSRDPGDIPGDYAVSAHIEDSGGNDVTDDSYYKGNIYIFPGTYKIIPLPLGNPRAISKVYDGTTKIDLDFSHILAPVLEGDDVNVDTSEMSAHLEDPNVNVNPYQNGLKKVLFSGELKFSGSKLYCYKVPNTSGSIMTIIDPAPLSIAAKETEMVQGTNPSTIDLSSAYTITGLVNGETENVLSGSLSITINPSITASTPPGVYPDGVLITGYTANNYEITYQSAPLIIKSSESALFQVITFDPIPEQSMMSGTYQLVATTSSGLPLSYVSSDPAIATVDATGLITFHSVGKTTITVSQSGGGSYDPALPVSQDLIIVSSSDNSLTKLVIDGTEWDIDDKYIIDCDLDFQQFDIDITTNQYAKVQYKDEYNNTVTSNKIVFVDNRKAFNRDVIFDIIAQDGTMRQCTLKVVRKFPFADVVIQSGNTLTLNPDPNSTGGYMFMSYKWLKNGLPVETDKPYTVTEAASYSMELLSFNGETLLTCPKVVVPSRSNFDMTITPNPVKSQKSVSINLANYQGNPNDIKIEVYDMKGNKIDIDVLITATTATFDSPSISGKYIVHVTAASDVKMAVLYVQ